MSTIQKPATRAHFERARRVIPGGIMSNFRKDEGYVPTYFSHGRGSHLFDLDGNEYIDYSLSYGPGILGHNHPALTEAIANQAGRFLSCESNPLEAEAAEKIKAHVPCAELIRFACSGTEAVYNACRVARGFTGRDKIVRFNGHYNGGLDELLGGVVNDPAAPVPVAGERDDDIFSQMTDTGGRKRHAFDDTFLIEWNDIGAIETLLDRHAPDIAALLMEPVMVNVSGCVPRPGYLEAVRALCDRHGVLLIFDEVITGFRIGLGGAQAHFGVTPDLATFAKALGGGIPVSAFCGRRDVMDVITRTEVMAGGTYNGHPLSMQGAITTITELERDGQAAMKRIQHFGQQLGDGLRKLFRQHDTCYRLQGFAGAWTLAWHPEREIIHNHAESLGAGYFAPIGAFIGAMNQRGVIMQTRMCTSAAHTQADVDEVLSRADDALHALKASGAIPA